MKTVVVVIAVWFAVLVGCLTYSLVEKSRCRAALMIFNSNRMKDASGDLVFGGSMVIAAILGAVVFVLLESAFLWPMHLRPSSSRERAAEPHGAAAHWFQGEYEKPLRVFAPGLRKRNRMPRLGGNCPNSGTEWEDAEAARENPQGGVESHQGNGRRCELHDQTAELERPVTTTEMLQWSITKKFWIVMVTTNTMQTKRVMP